MNIMELRKKPHLSASAINDYIDCSLQYKFGRIDRLKPEFTSDALIFGTVIHKVLDQFHQEKLMGNRMTLEEMQESFEKHWTAATKGKHDIKYANGKTGESLLLEGKDLLATYYDKFPGDNFKILAIEEAFSFNLPDLPLPIIGVFDLIEEDESDTIIIVDWKTAGKAYSRDDVDKNPQLTLYQMATKANGFKDREILLRFDCMIKTKTPKFEQYYSTRSETDERRMQKKILQVWDGISKGVFIPNDGHWKCKGCGYQTACKQWFES